MIIIIAGFAWVWSSLFEDTFQCLFALLQNLGRISGFASAPLEDVELSGFARVNLSIVSLV